jgi:hypothetical protein
MDINLNLGRPINTTEHHYPGNKIQEIYLDASTAELVFTDKKYFVKSLQ